MSVSSVEVVDLPTRRRVVNFILNERLHLTPAAVRRHLTVLLSDGTLESREQRVFGARGRGRPSKVFVLTDSGRTAFRQAYDDLAIMALKRLAVAAGPGAIREIATDRVTCIEERFRAARDRAPEAPAVELLVEVLAVDGYAPSIRPLHSGTQLLQHHCPIAHVATEFPELCEIETQLFARLLGTHVQRLATIAHGYGVCTTHVPHRLPTPAIPKRK